MGKAAAGKKTYFCSPLKGTPVFFCTPGQASALLAESRHLFFFVRHGSTDWNNEMRLQGREDIPLNSGGRLQARKCAEGIAAALSEGFRPVRVYTSPLSRARDTASYIAEATGAGDAVVIDDLIERDYSALTGLTPAERRERYNSPADYPADMESAADAALRIKRAVGTLRADDFAGCRVIVTHGGVMNSLFSCLTGGRAGSGRNITANCTVCVIAAGRNDVIPLAFNLDSASLIEYIHGIDTVSNH